MGGTALVDEDFPYSVIEDEEIIAKFKRIEDASSFCSEPRVAEHPSYIR